MLGVLEQNVVTHGETTHNQTTTKTIIITEEIARGMICEKQ